MPLRSMLCKIAVVAMGFVALSTVAPLSPLVAANQEVIIFHAGSLSVPSYS